MSVTLCRDTGRVAVRGSCPEHNGDACLIVLPAIADQRDEYRAALIDICAGYYGGPEGEAAAAIAASALDEQQECSDADPGALTGQSDPDAFPTLRTAAGCAVTVKTVRDDAGTPVAIDIWSDHHRTKLTGAEARSVAFWLRDLCERYQGLGL